MAHFRLWKKVHGYVPFFSSYSREWKISPKSEVSKRVGRLRGLARGNPSHARYSGLFSAPFFLCPLRRRGTHFCRTFLALFGGLFVANPPLFETSDKVFQTEVFSWTSVCAGCPCQDAIFSRIWRARPKFLAGCPQGYPAQNFLFGLLFRSWYRGPNPEKFKVTQKWPQKELFDPKQSLGGLFSGQKVTFGVTFESLGGGPPTGTFESLLSHFEFFGLWGPVAGCHNHKPWLHILFVRKIKLWLKLCVKLRVQNCEKVPVKNF